VANHRFTWTPQKRRAADLLARGYTKTEAADRIGTHRNIIHRWLHSEEFAARVNVERLEHETAIKIRRLRAVVTFTDAVEVLTVRALHHAEEKPTSLTAVRRATKYLAEYRHQRRQERIELGEPTTITRRRAGRRRKRGGR
jgi:transposase